MVNNLRKVPWTPPPNPLPEAEGARRKPGPIYDLAVVQGLAKGDQIFVDTDRCDTDLENLEWDVDDVAKLIAALEPDDYSDVSEWCKGRKQIVIDADIYTIRYDHIDECRGTSRHPIYYIKFGFRNNDPRLIIFLFSCHLSRTL